MMRSSGFESSASPEDADGGKTLEEMFKHVSFLFLFLSVSTIHCHSEIMLKTFNEVLAFLGSKHSLEMLQSNGNHWYRFWDPYKSSN